MTRLTNEYICACAGLTGIILLIGFFSVVTWIISIYSNSNVTPYDYSDSDLV